MVADRTDPADSLPPPPPAPTPLCVPGGNTHPKERERSRVPATELPASTDSMARLGPLVLPLPPLCRPAPLPKAAGAYPGEKLRGEVPSRGETGKEGAAEERGRE